MSQMSEISIIQSIVIVYEGKQVKSEDGGKVCSMLNKHNFQQPQVNKDMFTDVATLLVRTNISLAAMSSSSSDDVTQSVRSSVCPSVRLFVCVLFCCFGLPDLQIQYSNV